MNMDHVKFQNTIAAMEQCLDALREKGVEGCEEDTTHREERDAVRAFLEMCMEVANEFEDEAMGFGR